MSAVEKLYYDIVSGGPIELVHKTLDYAILPF